MTLSQNIPSTKCIHRTGKNIASQDWKLRWISFQCNILFTNFFSKLKIEEFQDFLSSLAKSICVYFGSTFGHLQLYSINECTIKSNGNFFPTSRALAFPWRRNKLIHIRNMKYRAVASWVNVMDETKSLYVFS